ncbi:hypothetical protein SMMN14_01762 [Sphaerulina musiva]
MFLLRTPRFTIPATRARAAAPFRVSQPFSTLPRLFSGSDYGSGEHNKEKNLESASHDKEHPGPAAPSTGGKSSSSSKKSNDKSVESGSESSSSEGAQPKILSESPPKENEQSDDVKSHNKEVKARVEGTYKSKEKDTHS